MHPDAHPEVHVWIGRHMQSLANVHDANYGDRCELSDLGKRQIRLFFRRLKTLKIQFVLSSMANRTLGTLLEAQSDIPFLACNEFNEWRRPACTVGKPNSDPEVAALLSRRINLFGPEYVPHDGEETFQETTHRIEAGLKLIREIARQNKVERILVLTHGLLARLYFCRMLVGICDDELFPLLFKSVHARTGFGNSGLLHAWYGREFRSNQRAWNVELADLSHLPERLR